MQASRIFAARGSNRTFMELKWESDPEELGLLGSSNRTFMELKLLLLAITTRIRVLIAPLWN